MNSKAPFKVEVVGSFLRPNELKQAREDYFNDKIDSQQLRKIEDRLIVELIEKQKKHGIRAVTDGEFRRRWWHLDFIEQLNGITKYSLGDITTFQNVQMENAEAYYVSNKISFNPSHTFLDDFKFTKKHAGDVITKQTIPGPNMIYLGGALLERHYAAAPVYESIEELEDDIVATYQQVIQALYDSGCRYLQLDDTAWGRLLNSEAEEQIKELGFSIYELAKRCADITKRSIDKKPDDMVITFHFCRGNFKSSWVYEGSYDNIAEELFSIENFDGFFLEYDTKRAGGFEPLKHLKGQKIILGLITSKSPELEDKFEVIGRIKQASQYVPINQICISPQCGFASTDDGNKLTEEEQWRKIQLLQDISSEVWV